MYKFDVPTIEAAAGLVHSELLKVNDITLLLFLREEVTDSRICDI